MMDETNGRVPEPEDPKVAALMAGMVEQTALADQIVVEEGIPHITAWVMAGDRLSARRALAHVIAGDWDAEKALDLTGSYARLDLAITLLKEGHLSEATLLAELPALWRGSDPDDTRADLHALWNKAWKINGKQPIYDGDPLPKGTLALYRGQMPDATLGLAWSLDLKVAEAFALTQGGRQTTEGGVVFGGHARPSDVYAFLTLRSEQEVVIKPEWVYDITNLKTGRRR